MSKLLTELNFQKIYFRGESFDQPTIEDGIEHLTKYLHKNIHSQSPFILFTACNHIKSAMAYYAILKAGKIAVLLDPETMSLEMDEIIKDVNPAAIISINEQQIFFNFSNEIIFRKQDESFSIQSDLRDVCTIAYTNAEDGYAKGAMLTQENFLSEIDAIIKTNYLTEEANLCALLPFSHLYGFTYGIITPTHFGGSGLITKLNLLKIEESVKEIANSKVTHVHTVPSVYYILSKVNEIHTITDTVKEFYSGGHQLSKFVFDSFLKKTNFEIREGYGLTECSPAIAGNYDKNKTFLGSFGKAFPGCEIKIFNDKNNECLPLEIGEIGVKGNMVFKGYFNHPDATKQVFKNGWFYTGDFGKKDTDGNIYFCGLKKNMINIGGNKVYPKKVERLIKTNPNVLSITIGGQVSLLQGSTAYAQVKLKDTSLKSQQELKKWCQQNINNSILPKTWLFE